LISYLVKTDTDFDTLFSDTELSITEFIMNRCHYHQWFEREICPNCTGRDVQRLQALLNLKYELTLAEDGIYGRKTIDVIEQIQMNSNLPVTGICDRRTLYIIENEPDGEPPRHGIKKIYQNKQLLQFLVLAIPLLVMAIALWKPELIGFIFHQDRLKILFFVSCVVWFLLVVDKILGLEISQILIELTKFLRDFLQIHNQ
jgi:hypothetical protein